MSLYISLSIYLSLTLCIYVYIYIYIMCTCLSISLSISLSLSLCNTYIYIYIYISTSFSICISISLYIYIYIYSIITIAALISCHFMLAHSELGREPTPTSSRCSDQLAIPTRRACSQLPSAEKLRSYRPSPPGQAPAFELSGGETPQKPGDPRKTQPLEELGKGSLLGGTTRLTLLV